MKLYQFLLLLTFCSVFINAYSVKGDILLPENLRKNVDGEKEKLCINIPGLKDEYVTNCRYHHNEQKVLCDIEGKNDLYVMIPVRSGLITAATKTEINVKEWYIKKRVELSNGGYEWVGCNEIMETGVFEKIEAADNYHGSYSIIIYGDKRDFVLHYDRIVINKY